ncbi:uncharacterized protein SPSK_10189 [Sporothrix schenckii 1099-18]|uniref:Uncharacterized protein n=1 Tax=Sporothrix schenckii 1099-18 TaxID=1397361 RepID=A0A0F2M9Y8_SPOSC|nr:uncharacterized protein SPSK_10189 [Sporothrix schenckii 1099-18]KJR85640.1 hypothetical protein SPSK_10189 [Sporothrix schenckii 1099-18]
MVRPWSAARCGGARQKSPDVLDAAGQEHQKRVAAGAAHFSGLRASDDSADRPQCRNRGRSIQDTVADWLVAGSGGRSN